MKMGLSPLPIKKGEKRPQIRKWQEFCRHAPDTAEFAEWMKLYNDANVGVALGTVVGDLQIIAVDVDAEDMIERVKRAVGAPTPAKKGKKGLTLFLLAESSVVNQKFINRMPDRKSGTLVEILARGSQTVIPPSIHPEGMPYEWIGQSLLDTDVRKLPVLTDAMIDEITAHAHGKGEHFDSLNTMVWKGVDGGGNTHDVCVAAVACMVARQWLDSDIVKRIDRAKREACERAGDSYSWPDAERTINGWIESARKKGMDTTSKAKRIPAERLVAEAIVHELNSDFIRLVTHQGQTLLYGDGYWRLLEDEEIMRMVFARDRSLTMAQINNITKLIRLGSQVDNFGEPGFTRICLQNGTYNLTTGRMELWASEHEIRHQLPFEWDDESTCPLYDELVNKTLDGDADAIRLWDEYCAHTLVPDMSFQRLLFLVGPGGTGKSTLASVLRSVHDSRAVSSVPITALHDERMRSMLVGKLINVSSEQSRLNPIADDYLKKITGGDLVDIRFLYKEPSNTQLYVRFLELANEMPSTKDVSDAIRRRLFILPCPNVVRSPDRTLVRRLHAERPAILRRWVRAYNELYARGEFIEPEVSRKEVSVYLLENDPIALWIDSRIDRDDAGTAGSELFSDFRLWAESSGYNVRDVPNMVQWGRRLTSLGFPSLTHRFPNHTFARIRKLKVREGMRVRV